MKAGTCRFFKGIQHDQCDAGITYADKARGQVPCIKTYGHKPGVKTIPVWHCDKYTEPSAEEIAKSKAEMEAAMERMTKTFPLISRIKKEHKGESWKGVEACPVCGGKLHMTHSAFNGHVWGKCETAGCVAWME